MMKAPEANPKRGGILRFGMGVVLGHFDMGQGSAVSVLTQVAMFDNVVRVNHLSPNREVIPELAHSWDISSDGKLFNFYLRPGVKFTDGAAMTSEDVVATLDRLIHPPEGVISPRESYFGAAAVSEVRASDPLTVQVLLSEARSPDLVLGALASGWNGIVRKQTLVDNNFDLKRVKDYPTTGPYIFDDYSDGAFFKMKANPNYWNPELPYLDGITYFHLNFWTAETAAALLANQVDLVGWMEPAGYQRALDHPEIDGVKWLQYVEFGLWFNTKKPALDDARVRRAIHMVLDRDALVKATENVHIPYLGAGHLFALSQFATPPEELRQRPGYRSGAAREEDIETARALLADAGYPDGDGFPELDLVVRNASHFNLQGAAVEIMLRQALNIKSKIRSQDLGLWFEEVQKGNFDMTIGTTEFVSADPSTYFRGMFGKGGSENYGLWEHADFDTIMDEMDGELDPVKRLEVMRKAELFLEQEMPFAPVAFEFVNEAWWNYVKGHDIHHASSFWDDAAWDTIWLDK
jgi:ABC-type transport system substrate-binding protein